MAPKSLREPVQSTPLQASVHVPDGKVTSNRMAKIPARRAPLKWFTGKAIAGIHGFILMLLAVQFRNFVFAVGQQRPIPCLPAHSFRFAVQTPSERPSTR